MLKVSKTLVKIKVGENCHPTTALPNNDFQTIDLSVLENALQNMLF
jgi:hypothetical protein